jgi:hypothetical protein
MEWCVRKGVDGVVTDDVKLFGEVCQRLVEDGKGDGDLDGKGTGTGKVVRKGVRVGVRMYVKAWLWQAVATVVVGLMWAGVGRKRKGKGKVTGSVEEEVEEVVEEVAVVGKI